jgi:hypothetical protein
MDLREALEALSPEDLFPVWCWIDDLERTEQIDAEEATLWKHAILELMQLWGLDPADLLPPSPSR